MSLQKVRVKKSVRPDNGFRLPDCRRVWCELRERAVKVGGPLGGRAVNPKPGADQTE